MAKLIKINSKISTIKPKNDRFSLKEINDLIGLYVHPFFNDNNWIFVDSFTETVDANYNAAASKLLKIDIWGDCLISNTDELLPSFLISSDFLNSLNNIYEIYITELSKMFKDIEQEVEEDDDEILPLNNDLKKESNNSNDAKKEEDIKNFEYFYIEAYKNLLELNISFKDLMKRFIIFRSNDKFIEINTNNNERISFLNLLINYFSDKEDYEKCRRIKLLKNYIEKNM
jgi:hypothetical protein